MRIIINGANGVMGHNVLKSAEVAGVEVAALVSRSYTTDPEQKRYGTLADFTGEADCVIDFSNHLGTADLLDYCVSRRMPVLIATTGHTDEEKALINKASESTAVFFAYNTSVGVAVLCDLVRRAAAAFPEADIEIIEKHHNRKLDAPSGTAILIADAIKEVRENAQIVNGRSGRHKREPQEIGIHALRYGNETGTHEIIISNGAETITLKHEAENRILFADGAIKAAAFVAGKPAGMYGMKDILG